MTTAIEPAADTAPAPGAHPNETALTPYDARYDAEAGAVVVPTPIPGLVLVFTRDQTALTAEQMHMLAPIGIEADWDPAQVAVFLLTCRAQGLDPWRKQAYLLLIDRKYVRHTAIGGLLSKAQATGNYRGTVGPQWCGPDGIWRDVWLDGATPPAASRVGILHADYDTPVWGVATYEEYAPMIDEWIDDPSGARYGDSGKPKRVKSGRQRPMANWKPARQGGKPAVMLEKCAKARGLRDAFPDECGGFYVPEETEVSRVADVAAREDADATPSPAEVAAERRRAAFDAAMDTAGEAGPFPVFAGLGLSDAAAREMLLAELDEQAGIMGKTRRDIVARWSESRGGTRIEDAGVRDVAQVVRAWRPYVLRKLRADGRDAEADRYQVAPDVAQVDDLFGRTATTITVDAA